MRDKKELLVFVQMMPVYPKTKPIPYFMKFLGLSYQRVYNLVSRFTYTSGLTEDGENNFCFVDAEAKKEARRSILSERSIS